MAFACLGSSSRTRAAGCCGRSEVTTGEWMPHPRRAAFAAVAAAIVKYEPVTVGASGAQFANARAQLAKRVRVVRLPSDDAWMRDVGPTIVVNDRGQRRGIDWRFNAWGGLNGGLYVPWDRDERVAQTGAGDRADRPLSRAADSRRWRDPRRRRGHVHNHRGMSAESEPQPRPDACADRGVLARIPRSRSRHLAWTGGISR